MRLRLRCVDTKETVKLDVPNSCSLPQLKEIVAHSLRDSPSPGSIRLSLNRKDEIRSEGEESLQTLGVATGDLIYVSFENRDDHVGSMIAEFSGRLDSRCTVLGFGFKAPDGDSKADGNLGEMEIDGGDTGISDDSDGFDSTVAGNSNSAFVGTPRGKTRDRGSEKEDTLGKMEIDDGDVEIIGKSDASSSSGVLGKSFSVPGFLRKVLTEELSYDGGRDHKLIIIAVHAAMLESGFVVFDKKSNMVWDRIYFQDDWPSGLFRFALHYTLPEAICTPAVEATKTVVLKFQIVGDFINIFGTADFDSSMRNVYRVQLNEESLIPYLNIVWANCWDAENCAEVDGIYGTMLPEQEVFKFWRTLKDSLALPLSIDLCEEAGFEFPPCFMRLPTDLKLKIFESLPGVDLGRVTCVCSELRYLGSNDDLWKLKFFEEFHRRTKDTKTSWKRAFVLAWALRKATALTRRPGVLPANYYSPPRRLYPNPFMVPRWPPRIIGGDYDIAPPPAGGGYARLSENIDRLH